MRVSDGFEAATAGTTTQGHLPNRRRQATRGGRANAFPPEPHRSNPLRALGRCWSGGPNASCCTESGQARPQGPMRLRSETRTARVAHRVERCRNAQAKRERAARNRRPMAGR